MRDERKRGVIEPFWCVLKLFKAINLKKKSVISSTNHLLSVKENNVMWLNKIGELGIIFKTNKV